MTIDWTYLKYIKMFLKTVKVAPLVKIQKARLIHWNWKLGNVEQTIVQLIMGFITNLESFERKIDKFMKVY